MIEIGWRLMVAVMVFSFFLSVGMIGGGRK